MMDFLEFDQILVIETPEKDIADFSEEINSLNKEKPSNKKSKK